MATPLKSAPRLRPVDTPEALAALRGLFLEYWDALHFSPCFQNFSEELANLPGAYAPPDGRLALAWVQTEPAGCIALRRLDGIRAEGKRLYVRPAFRGCGIGRALLEWLINEARQAGYSEMVGDTLPTLASALAIYDRMGFERTGPYTEQISAEGLVYIRLKL
jgi:putative acetyltransferase